MHIPGDFLLLSTFWWALFLPQRNRGLTSSVTETLPALAGGVVGASTEPRIRIPGDDTSEPNTTPGTSFNEAEDSQGSRFNGAGDPHTR